MLTEFTKALDQIIVVLQNNSLLALEIVAGLWIIHAVNKLLDFRLNALGLYPREIHGLIGIPCSPLLHGNTNHIFFNSIPLFLLLTLMLANGVHPFIVYTVNIALIGGGLTWIFGRKAIHVGSSGVIMGYMGFLLMQAINDRSAYALILGAIALYYCSSLLLHLFPTDEKSSWEGHVFGFIAGVLVAYGVFIPF